MNVMREAEMIKLPSTSPVLYFRGGGNPTSPNLSSYDVMTHPCILKRRVSADQLFPTH